MDLPRRIELAGCVVDLGARLARWPDGDRSLTPTETGLLSHLMAAEGRVVSQRDLLREVWGYRGGVVSRTVKTTVGRLRAKIERDASNPDHLLTVVGAGYRFEGGDPRDDEATVDEPAPREGGVTRVFLPQRPIGVVGRDALVSTASEAVSASSK